MNRRITVFAALLAVSASSSAAMAGMIVMEVDVTNPAAVEIRTTGGHSQVTAGGQGYAVILSGFLPDPPTQASADMNGNFGPADGALFTFLGGYTRVPTIHGLGLYGFNSNRFFHAGEPAFVGQSTANMTFLNLPGGGLTGDVLLRNNFGDLTGHVIGQYTVVPEPGTLAMLGLGGLATLLRRRR